MRAIHLLSSWLRVNHRMTIHDVKFVVGGEAKSYQIHKPERVVKTIDGQRAEFEIVLEGRRKTAVVLLDRGTVLT